VRWRRVICLFAFHKWVRRPTPGDPTGYRHECVRCGKLNEGPDVDPRFQGAG
jgi:hypothetical protein